MKQCGFSLMLAIITLFVTTSAIAENEVTVDEIQCGQAIIKAYSECSTSEDLWPNCSDQRMVVTKPSGKSVTKKLSGGTGAALVSHWACVQGKSAKYLILTFANGGNCPTCEWAEIYDLSGKRLASDQKKGNHIKLFNDKYGEFGLPKDWPEKSFKRIGPFKEMREGENDDKL